jgi:hypothetical protein
VKEALLKLGLPTLSRHQPEGPFGLLANVYFQKHGPAVFIFLLLGVSSMTSKDRVPEKRC